MISGVPINYVVTPIKDDYKAIDNEAFRINVNRRIRFEKFPTLKYRKSIEILLDGNDNQQNVENLSNKGEHIPDSQFKNKGVRDTNSLQNQTEEDQVKYMVRFCTNPQVKVLERTTNEKCDKIFKSLPKFPREKTWSPGSPTSWNNRKTLDIVTRSKLGGWTSSEDPRKTSAKDNKQKTSPAEEMSKLQRDKLALKYQYGTSTQRAYEEVPWDSLLRPKVRPPTSTLEKKPDSVSHQLQNNNYEMPAQEWQSVGKSLDIFLLRKGCYKDGPITFCSPYPRYQQIPSYSGKVGAENVEENDNDKETFEPFTVKRNTIPWPSETSHRPNIPCYTGCTTWQGYYAPFQTTDVGKRYPPVYGDHLSKAQSSESPESHKRKSEMSRMVTLVPPHNPYNTTEKEPIDVK